MNQTRAKRISRIAQELELSVEELSSRSGLHKYRIRRVLGGKAPDDEEIEGFAKVFGLHRIEIENSLAERFGKFLRANSDYWSFSTLWPTIDSAVGQRIPREDDESTDALDDAPIEAIFEEVLEGHQAQEVWYPYGPPPPFWDG